MRLSGVRPGDLVLVDDGLQSYCRVEYKLPQRLVVRPLHGNTARREVKSRHVVAHFKRMGRVREEVTSDA